MRRSRQIADDADGVEREAGPRAGVPPRIAGIAVLPASSLRLDDEDLATLRSPFPQRSAAALLAAAEAFVPHPWSADSARPQETEAGSEAPIDLREPGFNGS